MGAPPAKIQGHNSNRRPDNQIVDANGRTRKVDEVERKPNSKRHKLRQKEYDDLGIEHTTAPIVKKPPVKKPKIGDDPASGGGGDQDPDPGGPGGYG